MKKLNSRCCHALFSRYRSSTKATFSRHGAGFLFLHHCGRFDDGSLGLDSQMTQYRVIEAERVLQFVQRFLVALDIHQHVMCLVDLLDRVSQLAAAPVFQTVDKTALGRDQCAITLDHRGHLLALIGMHDKNDLVMSHYISLWLKPPPCRGGGAGGGVNTPPNGGGGG